MPPRPVGVPRTQRGVAQEGAHFVRAQHAAELLGAASGVTEDQALLAHGAAAQSRLRRFPATQHDRSSRRHPCSRWHCPPPSRSPEGANQSSSSRGLLTVADRADALQRSLQILVEPMQHRAQVPASVVGREGMQLVDDHGSAGCRTRPVAVDPGRDQHGLDGFRCRQQDVRRIFQSALRLRDCETSPCQTSTRRPTSPA
jgi:hypothetical protein